MKVPLWFHVATTTILGLGLAVAFTLIYATNAASEERDRQMRKIVDASAALQTAIVESDKANQRVLDLKLQELIEAQVEGETILTNLMERLVVTHDRALDREHQQQAQIESLSNSVRAIAFRLNGTASTTARK